jgi:hypothetical protein
MDEFLFHIIRNKMKIGASQTSFVVNTHLVALTANEAGRIARSFPMVMMANVSAEAAVDEFIVTYQALGELDREYAWFRSMLAAIATEVMNAVAWGVKFRAYLGAGVSFGDMASDAYMIRTFYETSRPGVARSLLAMVLLNLAFQLSLVYLQTNGLKSKDRWRTILVEVLSVVTFVKPGLDAFRVASGQEQRPGSAVEPLAEMVFTKTGEVCFEGIPGLVLQLMALMRASEITPSSVVSILISIASTALTATTIFWDIDTNPGVRKRNPDWCVLRAPVLYPRTNSPFLVRRIGMIPDLGRGSAFFVVFLMSSAQVAAKALATALLAVTNPVWLWYYILGDHGLYQAYQIVRRNLVVYTPMPKTASYLTSPMVHIMGKIITDYTGCIHFRLPLMLTGAYFSFSSVASQASVFVAVHLYLEHAQVPGEGVEKIEGGVLWAGAGTLVGTWLVLTLYFVFRVAVPKYRHTLWSWTSGRQCVQDYFIKGKSEEDRFAIFTNNLLLWESDIGDEVKAWTAENWARWTEEKQVWFKPAMVPDQFIPVGALQQLGYNRKRRGSAVESMRESFREASVGEEDADA